MKKVLIITYYWPPAGGGGVQRWLKMSKYLPENGWIPVIYTPSNPEVTGMDDALVKEIHPETITIKSPIWEPYDLYKKVLGIKKEEKIYSGFINKDSKSPKWLKKFTTWIRGNFFIPDARRFWINPGSRFLIEYLKTNPVDVIISTGPPHSTHLIAMKVHKMTNIPWIADFRDPWTEIDFYKQLNLSWIADKYHHHLEKKVLTSATKVVTVSPSWQSDLTKISGRNDIQLITNGYDPADFEEIVTSSSNMFVISHIGSMNEDRNPEVLWKALQLICKQSIDFATKLKIQLIGPVDGFIFESLKHHNLDNYIEHIPFVAHDKAIKYMKEASLLLLCINNTDNKSGILPGKMYEYMGSNQPMICIGPNEGDSIQILKEYQVEALVLYNELQKCSDRVRNVYNSLSDVQQLQSSNFNKYSRANLAKSYSDLCQSILMN